MREPIDSPEHDGDTTHSTACADRADQGARAPAAAPARSVEIVVSWGATVLHVGHVAPPRAFDLGERRDDGRPCDCFLPEQVLGARRAPLLVTDAAGRVAAVLLPRAAGTITTAAGARSAEQARGDEDAKPCAEMEGAIEIPLEAGTEMDVTLAGVRLRVTAAAAAPAGVGRSFASRRSLGLYAGSALVHLAVLGAFALGSPPPGHPDDGPSAEQVFRIQQYLAAADEREMEARETEQNAEATADAKEGGTGARAKGEEGSMGDAQRLATGQRFGVAGPSDDADPHIARQAALRDAAEFGMVGLLNSGSGGDPNAPSSPMSARGNMWGDQVGESFGAGGLGLTGYGEGGAGRGEGVGLGSIGTIGHGAGTGSGQGFGSGHGAAPQAQAPVAAVAPPPVVLEAPIDPNGRFATTYRPGGGHLAAFESAVSRGIVPAVEREVVSDVGARYLPGVALDPGKAIALRLDPERRAVPPTGGPVHLRLALRSSAQAPAARPHLSVHLVLDASGSMAGEPIDKARRAAQALVDRLAPTDDFSLTVFSSGAEIAVPDGLVGPRRDAIKRVIGDLRDGGGTNIHEGLRLAYTQAKLPSIPEDAVRVVLLLSDGRATSGDTSRDRITRLALDAFQDGIQTSAFGLGSDYDGELMSNVAADGAGGYYYLRDGDQIAHALTTELEHRLDPVATAVEVRVRLKKDVGLLRVYGSRRLNEAEAARVRVQEVAADAQAQKRDKIAADRKDDNEGGMRFFMPAFARDDSHAMLLKLSLPPGTSARTLGTVELKYKDRIAKTNVTEEIPIKIEFANGDAESAATADASVARTVQGFAAGEALTQAAFLIGRGDRNGAAALLEEREGILRQAARTLEEPLFISDAARLARLRGHARTESGLGDPLVLAMLLETAGRSHMR